VAFEVNESGEVVLRKADGTNQASAPKADRFEAARGKADIKWRTEDLMALLRD
jgi:antitoxin PrlF